MTPFHPLLPFCRRDRSLPLSRILRFCCAAPALMYDKYGLLKIVEEDGVRSRALVRGDHV
jgi:hypothetical protein